MATFKLRRDYSHDWNFKNPVLALGEPGWERDTRQLKIGDGVTPWTDLQYFAPMSAESALVLEAHINATEPHPAYDDGPNLLLLYENAKV